MLKRIYRYWGKLEVYKRFLISYILILIIPIAFSTVVYQQAVKTIEQDAIATRVFMIGQIRDSIDQYFLNLDRYSDHVNSDSKVNRLLSYDSPKEGSSDMYWFYEFFDQLKKDMVKDIDNDSAFYLFLNKSEAVYFKDGIHFGFESFYKDYLNLVGMDYNRWYGAFIETKYFKDVLPPVIQSLGGVSKPFIPYLTSMPLGKETQMSGLILYLIDEQKIIDLLERANTSHMGWTYISSGDGTVISTTNKDKVTVTYDQQQPQGYSVKFVNGEKMLCIYAKSNFSDWTYTNVLPVSGVMGKAKTIKHIAIAMIVITFGIGVLAALFLSYVNTKQFKVVSKSLEHQADVLEKVFWDKVFNGQFQGKSELDALMKHLGLDYNSQNFVVAVVKLNRHDSILNAEILSELDVLRASFETILYECLGANCHINILNENEAAFIVNFPIVEQQQIKKTFSETLKKMSKELSAHCSIMPVFGVGNIYDSLMEGELSRNEAEQALKLSIEQATKDNNVFWYQDIKTEKAVYYYPNSIEQKLINCAKLADYDAITLLLKEVYEQNYTKRFIASSMERMLRNDMCSTVIKLLEDSNLDMASYDVDILENKSKEEFFDKIKKGYEQICVAIADTRKDHTIKLIEEILEFVKLNYTDSNMCVYMVASKFGLSESYFSQFFKENAGVNFSAYVENARIQKACELINNTTMSLDEISSQVGYNNAHTFRRAFKKVIGVVPSAYKK